MIFLGYSNESPVLPLSAPEAFEMKACLVKLVGIDVW